MPADPADPDNTKDIGDKQCGVVYGMWSCDEIGHDNRNMCGRWRKEEEARKAEHMRRERSRSCLQGLQSEDSNMSLALSILVLL